MFVFSLLAGIDKRIHSPRKHSTWPRQHIWLYAHIRAILKATYFKQVNRADDLSDLRASSRSSFSDLQWKKKRWLLSFLLLSGTTNKEWWELTFIFPLFPSQQGSKRVYISRHFFKIISKYTKQCSTWMIQYSIIHLKLVTTTSSDCKVN